MKQSEPYLKFEFPQPLHQLGSIHPLVSYGFKGNRNSRRAVNDNVLEALTA